MLDGAPVRGSRDGANLVYRLPSPLQPGTTHSLAVTYSGRPTVTGGLGGGMMFASHAGIPSATTLSEPFDSYAWWPCVDDVKDKATMEMHLTVPAGMTGASNGTLTGVRTNADGTLTYDWREDYPLSNYLICGERHELQHLQRPLPCPGRRHGHAHRLLRLPRGAQPTPPSPSRGCPT